jgi:hypothetical protein
MLKSKPSKSMSSKFMPKFKPSNFRSSKSKFILPTRHTAIAALCLLAAFLALPSSASAQFTLQAAPLSPDAVPPTGTSSSNITVGTLNGFNSTVDLTCQVTSTIQGAVDPPSCTVSPASVTPPANASATITTQVDTTTVAYSITITGTAPSTAQTASTQPLSLTVLAVTPQFTITVAKAVVPSSVPAGSGGEGTITINPINGYHSPPGTPGVTLSCATITPLVTIPPVCSFSPNPVMVPGPPSTLTISTFGPVTTGAVARPRNFYALWMPVPMLALVGLGVAVGGKRSRKAWGLLALFVISGTLFLMPACGNTTTSTTTPNGVTPNNSYTFTLVGVDSDGVASSNTGSTSTTPTVSLTVTTPAN